MRNAYLVVNKDVNPANRQLMFYTKLNKFLCRKKDIRNMYNTV